jgi:alpha-L-fucosidase
MNRTFFASKKTNGFFHKVQSKRGNLRGKCIPDFVQPIIFFVISLSLIIILSPLSAYAQNKVSNDSIPHPDLTWFRNAKFGLIIHWGLYSQLAGQWKGHDYFGSGEWIQERAKIPAKVYAKVAKHFDPVDFNAKRWVRIAKESGVRYLVITAKHHEGFAMFNSKVSHFNIVDDTPYKKDPLKALSAACRKAGIKFGFYYSQFLDWHEPNGGGNTWDFNKKDKDYLKYYRNKAIPQLKELLTNYGPINILWFDQSGGLTKKQTIKLVNNLHKLQPQCLFSSRVGHGLGNYRDFGDSQIPAAPIKGAWEALFTDNDTWGYIAKDKDFKSSTEIIRLLAKVASKGGNLIFDIGPDGKGNWPPYEVKYLLKTGKWLKKYGTSIYGTTYGLIPPQPWGVTTSKPGKLYLHIFRTPSNNKIFVPFVQGTSIKEIRLLGTNKSLSWIMEQGGIRIKLPTVLPDTRDAVVEIDYGGNFPDHSTNYSEITVNRQYPKMKISVVEAEYKGSAKNKTITSSHYFGDWKHDNCAVNMKDTSDALIFHLNIKQPGVYRIILDYACTHISAGQEGLIQVAGQKLYFRSLQTVGKYYSHKPLVFIQHHIGLITIPKKRHYKLYIRPAHSLKDELFWLRNVTIQPIE